MFTLQRKISNSVHILWFGENPDHGGIDELPRYVEPKSIYEVAKGEQVDDLQKKNQKLEKQEESEIPNKIDPLEAQLRMENARKKGVEIAEKTQAPATNPNQTEAAEIGLQQKEALSQTFP